MQIAGGKGRVVTLVDQNTAAEVAKALVLRYSYNDRSPDAQWHTTTYPGPQRNLVNCYALAGPVEYTLSIL
ncbi:hypothetical protein GCM10009616_06310 [Microlunatus lacustris]